MAAAAAASILAAPAVLAQQVVFEATSPYHHIRVLDDRGMRFLKFDDSQETRMSLADPLQGHFEYTEYFHMPFLWNPKITNVLMIGLGGGSTQRSFLHHHPGVQIDTVELDPVVVTVAKEYFKVPETPQHKITTGDGRLHLRRSAKKYDLIVMDAYSTGRYGSSLPHHLVTREFFAIARENLSEEGIIAYNVIGTLDGWRSDLIGAVYRTLRAEFPQVYLFPARDSLNIVFIATKDKQAVARDVLLQRARQLAQAERIKLPTFQARAASVRHAVPPRAARAPVLTDDHAPLEGLMSSGN